MTLISTIIPVYNGETYLRDAVESVVSQDYGHQEVIIVDDGSQDASKDIAASFSEVKVISRSHEGVASARNAGIQASSGELLAFLDADDLWEAGKLTKQVDYLSAHPDVEGVFGLMRNFVQDGIERPGWLPDHQVDRDVPGHSLCTLLVKRSVFDQVGSFDPSIESGEDGDWFFRAKDLGVSFAMMPERLLLRRIHSRNLTHDAKAVRAGILRVVRDSVKRRQSEEN